MYKMRDLMITKTKDLMVLYATRMWFVYRGTREQFDRGLFESNLAKLFKCVGILQELKEDDPDLSYINDLYKSIDIRG